MDPNLEVAIQMRLVLCWQLLGIANSPGAAVQRLISKSCNLFTVPTVSSNALVPDAR